MNKKLICTLLGLALLASGCASAPASSTSSGTPESSQSSEGSVSEESSSQSEAESVADASSEEPPAASAGADSGDIGDYHVAITGAAMGTDYEGKDVLIVTYEWTNNSEETTSFIFSFTHQAFQNGIECESAIGVDGVESADSMKDIRPGATLEVKEAYVLGDTTSPVEVEVTELMSFTDSGMVTKTFDLPIA
ncbi:MAG: DUF5067 domain-containing protein [Oscillospiraceae bacterium]